MGSAFSKCCQADDATQNFLANNPGTLPVSKSVSGRKQREITDTQGEQPEQTLILGMLKQRNERSNSLPTNTQDTVSETEPLSPSKSPATPWNDANRKGIPPAPSIVNKDPTSPTANDSQTDFVSNPISSGTDTPVLKGTDSPFLERTAQSSDGAGIVVVACVDHSPALSPLHFVSEPSSEQQKQNLPPGNLLLSADAAPTAAHLHSNPETGSFTAAREVMDRLVSAVTDALGTPLIPPSIPDESAKIAAAAAIIDKKPTETDSVISEPISKASDFSDHSVHEPALPDVVVYCDSLPTITAALSSPPLPPKKRGNGLAATVRTDPNDSTSKSISQSIPSVDPSTTKPSSSHNNSTSIPSIPSQSSNPTLFTPANDVQSQGDAIAAVDSVIDSASPLLSSPIFTTTANGIEPDKVTTSTTEAASPVLAPTSDSQPKTPTKGSPTSDLAPKPTASTEDGKQTATGSAKKTTSKASSSPVLTSTVRPVKTKTTARTTPAKDSAKDSVKDPANSTGGSTTEITIEDSKMTPGSASNCCDGCGASVDEQNSQNNNPSPAKTEEAKRKKPNKKNKRRT